MSDNELIRRFLDGQTPKKQREQAFAELFMRYQPSLLKYATRLCKGDRFLAEDIVQETFLRAFISLASFRAEAKLTTWLHRIAFNCAVSIFRKHHIDSCSLEDHIEQADDQQELQSIDLERDLNNAMQTINPTQQKIIQLCVFEGHSHEHVASIAQMPLGTVKTNVRRSKIVLQEYLSDWREAA